jgi:4,5-DOPA dioxygenase extradiol
MSPTTTFSIPTLDHYLPMISVVGLQEEDDPLEFIHEGFQNRSVSMGCFRIA